MIFPGWELQRAIWPVSAMYSGSLSATTALMCWKTDMALICARCPCLQQRFTEMIHVFSLCQKILDENIYDAVDPGTGG